MLIISRKLGESFFIGDDIEVTVWGIGQDKIKIGISAPSDVSICRKEIKETKDENFRASKAAAKDKLVDLGKYITDEIHLERKHQDNH